MISVSECLVGWTRAGLSAKLAGMKIYLATGNAHKKKEVVEILSGHTIVIPSDEGIDFEPIENGTSFYENSLIKAKALYEQVRCPVIADDSGICVEALGGLPGIYSARYGGPAFPRGNDDGTALSQDEKNRALIQQLNDALVGGVPGADDFKNGPRSAHYTCAAVLYLGADRFVAVQEIMEGKIIECIEQTAGGGGFGYDPIFMLPSVGKTAAELNGPQKNALSHRGKAMRILIKAIEGILSECDDKLYLK